MGAAGDVDDEGAATISIACSGADTALEYGGGGSCQVSREGRQKSHVKLTQEIE